jgi:hypothetical protein
MKNDFLRRVLAVSAVLVLVAGKIIAQAPGTGAISGTVYDPSNRAIASAQVLTVNQATHVSRTVLTTAEGTFHVVLLLPGNYSVTVKAQGFADHITPSVAVTVSETISFTVMMTVAGESSSVHVTSDAEMAETESSTLGRAVEPESIQLLPLANRNYTQILGLSPGVIVALPDATALGRGTQNVSSDGAKTTSNNIQFNGIDANNASQNSAANDGEEVGTGIPAPDAIQEFMVQTANYDASYGRGTGANVDLVSKGGSNQFHGSAWEFVRNNIFNANSFFLNQDGQPRPDLKQNQFGGSIGGPIRRNKTLFFGEYQGLSEINGDGDAVTTDLPQLTSDRSAATLGAQFCPANKANATPYLTDAGGTQVACNGSNINPVALALLNYKFGNGQYAVPNPQVNLPVTNPNQLPLGQSTYAIPATYKENQFSVNIDQVIAQHNTLSGRFFYSRAPTIQALVPGEGNASVPGWPTKGLAQNTMFVLADTHVINSNLINVARFGFMRYDGVSAVFNPIAASALGMGTPTGVAGVAPGMILTGLFTTGDAGTPSQWENTNSFIWQDTVSKIWNRHNLRLGAEVKRHEIDINAPFSTDGLLFISTFDDFLLGESATQNGSPYGISNVIGSGGSSGFFRKSGRYTDYAAFAQDDIKITQLLTVNAGLRYEIFGPAVEKNGRLPNFDPSIAMHQAPSTGTLSGFTLPANFSGPIATGVTQTATAGLWATDFTAISPRLGFSLRLTQKPTFVMRGGYGIYYDKPTGGFAEGQGGQQPFSIQQFPFGAQDAAATLQSPFSPRLPLTSSFPLYSPRVPGGGSYTSGVSPHVADPMTQEYNLNFQYAFANDYLLEVGYVGTHTTNAPGRIQFNQALLASPQNSINGVTTNTAANVSQRLPFQGIAPGSLQANTEFMANYNSLQSSITKRFVHGLQFLGSYTWSKDLDETSGSGGADVFELWLTTNDQTNPRQAYGLTDRDRAQRVVANFTWDAPKLQNLPVFARHVLSDWEFSGIGVIQSGSPITVLDSNAGLVYGNEDNVSRAQRAGGNPSTSGSLYSRVLKGYLNQNAFTIAPEAPNGNGPGDTGFGNSGVGIVRGPGQHNVDFAVERVFPLMESSSLHFRTEFFNLTNTPQFANPNNMLNFSEGPQGPVNQNPSFGMITGTAANPRIIQFAMKYMF